MQRFVIAQTEHALRQSLLFDRYSYQLKDHVLDVFDVLVRKRFHLECFVRVFVFDHHVDFCTNTGVAYSFGYFYALRAVDVELLLQHLHLGVLQLHHIEVEFRTKLPN